MHKSSILNPPKAKKIHKELEAHADVRIDNYFWMNNREDDEVIKHLNAENDYCDAMLAHTKDFQTNLFEEMKGRIKEDDSSVPYKYNGYLYITKFETGSDMQRKIKKFAAPRLTKQSTCTYTNVNG